MQADFFLYIYQMSCCALHKFTFIIFLLSLTACTKKVGMLPCDPSYKKNIKPIIDFNCAISGCHVSGAFMGDYTTYAGLKAKADNGKLKLLVVDNNTMPLNSSLTSEQIGLIKCWIENGAKNN